MDARFSWLQSSGVRKLLEAFSGKAEVRFVGGAVRDSFLSKAPVDFDLATPLLPEKVALCLKNAGITCIPTGLKHGTVTAVLNKAHYEITTLRQDRRTDGRWADVDYVPCWHQDACRRDFTIGALYVDRWGQIYDFFNGVQDLNQGVIRFIGCPEKRVLEDFLRILRFFRMYAYHGHPPLDARGLEVCCALKDNLASLSKERITKEFLRLLDAPDPWPVLQQMEQNNFLPLILGSDFQVSNWTLHTLEKELGQRPSVWVRLCHLGQSQLQGLKLSNAEKKMCSILNAPLRPHWPEILESLYAFGVETTKDRLWMWSDIPLMQEYFAKINRWTPQPFPLTGNDFLQKGYSGTELGRLLKETYKWWLQQNTLPDRTACLQHIDKVFHSPRHPTQPA